MILYNKRDQIGSFSAVNFFLFLHTELLITYLKKAMSDLEKYKQQQEGTISVMVTVPNFDFSNGHFPEVPGLNPQRYQHKQPRQPRVQERKRKQAKTYYRVQLNKVLVNLMKEEKMNILTAK